MQCLGDSISTVEGQGQGPSLHLERREEEGGGMGTVTRSFSGGLGLSSGFLVFRSWGSGQVR